MLLPAQFYIISSVLVLFGTKNPSASTAEVPRYQQVSVISLTRPASAGSFPGWGNSPHSREGHGVTVQLCIPSTDCSGQPKDELQQFTITIHTERHSSPALALAVLPLYTHLLKPSCHHPTAPGRLDCLTPEWQCFPPGGAWGPLAARAASVHHCWLERMRTETQVQIEDSGHASPHTGFPGVLVTDQPCRDQPV